MAQHHSLGQPRRTRRIDQKREVILGVHPHPRLTGRGRDLVKVHELTRRVSIITEQNNPIKRQTDLLRSGGDSRQERLASGNRLGAIVLQLERKLVNRVSRVRRRDDPAREKGPVDDDRDVDTVGRKESDSIIFLPVPRRPEAVPKCDGRFLNTGISIVATGNGVSVDDWWKKCEDIPITT